MTTLAQLADLAQEKLADSGATHWSQSQIETWCNEAIADYSNHFPRTIDATISVSASDRQYDLPADFQEMIEVEYPTGENPPCFLRRVDRNSPSTWGIEGYYDILTNHDTDNADEIWLSELPAGAGTITYRYLGDHDHDLASSGTVTVPTHHENILLLYVQWKALQSLANAEHQNPTSNSSLLMSQLTVDADRMERSYRRAIQEAQGQRAESAIITWQPAGTERVY